MADPIAASLARSLGRPAPPDTYIGAEDKFRPIVQETRAGLPGESEFTYNAFQFLLEKLAAIEPLFQVPCERETAILEELFQESAGKISYGLMIHFYVTRALSRLNYGAAPIIGPSLDIGCGDGLTPRFVFKG